MPTDLDLQQAMAEAFCEACDGELGEWQEGGFGEVWVPCAVCQSPAWEWWEIEEGA